MFKKMGTKKQIYKITSLFLVMLLFLGLIFPLHNGAEGKELEKDDVAETDIRDKPGEEVVLEEKTAERGIREEPEVPEDINEEAEVLEEYPDDIDLVLGEEEAAAADADIEESGLETRPEQNKQSLSAITPLETTTELHFTSDTQVYKLVGSSMNDKNVFTYAWILDDKLYIAVATQTNKPVQTLRFKDNTDENDQNFISFTASEVLAATGEIENYPTDPGSPLYVNGEGPFYVHEHVPFGNEHYYWAIYNLGELSLRGAVTLELLTGAGGFDVRGEQAIWHVKGALEIHKIAYDQYGEILNPAEEFEITVHGPGGFQKVVKVTSGKFVLLGDLANGTYYAAEEAEDYHVSISDPVTVGANIVGVIIVTNTRVPDIPVTIRKEVTGNLGDLSREFRFTVAINDGPPTEFKLSDGEEYKLTGIRPKDVITLTEDNGGYEVTVMVDETVINPNSDHEYIIDLSAYSSAVTIMVKNHKDVIIDTGISLDTLPYVLMLILAAIGLSVIIIRKGNLGNEK